MPSLDYEHISPATCMVEVLDESINGTSEQDIKKLSFFDLPPELRDSVYRLLCTEFEYSLNLHYYCCLATTAPLVYKDWYRSTLALKRQTPESCPRMHLVSRQFSAELMATWVEQTCLVVPLNVSCYRTLRRLNRSKNAYFTACTHISRARLAYLAFYTLRDFLLALNERFGNNLVKKAHRIKLTVWLNPAQSVRPIENLREYEGRAVARALERLDSSLVHPDLLLKLEIQSEHSPAWWLGRSVSKDPAHRARRTLAFQLRPASATAEREKDADWVCTGDGLDLKELMIVNGEVFSESRWFSFRDV